MALPALRMHPPAQGDPAWTGTAEGAFCFTLASRTWHSEDGLVSLPWPCPDHGCWPHEKSILSSLQKLGIRITQGRARRQDQGPAGGTENHLFGREGRHALQGHMRSVPVHPPRPPQDVRYVRKPTLPYCFSQSPLSAGAPVQCSVQAAELKATAP